MRVGNVAMTRAAPIGPLGRVSPGKCLIPTDNVRYLLSLIKMTANISSFHACRKVKMPMVESAGFMSGSTMRKKMP